MVPEAVRRKAFAVGAAGQRWLHELDQVLADLAVEWGLELGEPIVGGSAAYVTEAVTADGTAVVLKLAIPGGLEGQGAFARELWALLAGDGRGYVRVLRGDERRRAMLQERLGRSLSALGLPIGSQIEIIVSTLQRAWRDVPEPTPVRTGAEQATFLDEFIRATWDGLGRPCPQATVERAQTYARRRRDAFQHATSVLIHGDAHPTNILEDPTDVHRQRFKLIDPDGMLSERAHDLAIPLRDWSDELLAGDPVELALTWCAQLSESTGVNRQAIWEWAFVERVSTGLFLTKLGEQRGALLLEVADRLTAGEQAGS